MSQPRATDDEGKPIRVLDPAGLCEWPLSGDERIAGLIERVNTAARVGTAAAIWTSMYAIVAALLILAIFWLGITGWLPLPSWTRMPSAWLISTIAGALAFRTRLAVSGRAIADVLIEDGLCPCCGYNFAGLFRDAPILRCPECGAAWRTDRIRRAVAFADGSKLGPAGLALRESKSPHAAIVVDARGRSLVLKDPTLRVRLARAQTDGDAASERRLERARDRIALVKRSVRLTFAWVAICVALAMATALLAIWSLSPVGQLWWILPPTLLALGVGLLSRNFIHSPRKAAEILAQEGLCPACTADLGPPSSDRAPVAATCPRCGGAWLVLPPENHSPG